MIVSFLESIKYVGHLIPMAFLRIFLGSYFLQSALMKFHGDFLLRPKLAAQFSETLPTLELPVWYRQVLEKLLITHWQTFAFVILGIELAIGISYIIGYVVRPMALLASLICIQFLILSVGLQSDLYKLFLVIHLTLAWVGAGRCLGVDYYFYKKRRGFWW